MPDKHESWCKEWSWKRYLVWVKRSVWKDRMEEHYPLLWVAASSQISLNSNFGQAKLASHFLFCQVSALNRPKNWYGMKFADSHRHKWLSFISCFLAILIYLPFFFQNHWRHLHTSPATTPTGNTLAVYYWCIIYDVPIVNVSINIWTVIHHFPPTNKAQMISFWFCLPWDKAEVISLDTTLHQCKIAVLDEKLAMTEN